MSTPTVRQPIRTRVIRQRSIRCGRGPTETATASPVVLMVEHTLGGVTFTKPFITTEELATVLQVDASTIRRWRTSTPLQGPPFINLSERVTIYSAEDVQTWLAARRVVPGAAK